MWHYAKVFDTQLHWFHTGFLGQHSLLTTFKSLVRFDQDVVDKAVGSLRRTIKPYSKIIPEVLFIRYGLVELYPRILYGTWVGC